MGIPGFFGFIRKYHKPDAGDNIIKTEFTEEFQNITKKHLFLDFNGGIYTVYNKYKHEIKTNDALINNVLSYLDTLRNIHPNLSTFYIAIDGVPPRAKIEQQRTRRFHSVDEKNTLLKINQRFGEVSDNTNSIDTNMITPGTQFMHALHNKIIHHLETNPIYHTNPDGTPIKVIFSGYNVPLEGEHKILQYLKKNNEEGQWENNDMIMIYGLDADLIMLSMASGVNNIYLLREKTEYGQYSFNVDGYEFLYLDIDLLKSCLIFEFEENLGFDIDLEKIPRFIDDYTFLCFILGNDFIPKIPWLSIKNKGIITLTEAYYKTYNLFRDFLINTETMKINNIFLSYLFRVLADKEEEEMKRYHNKRQKSKINMFGVKSEQDRQKRLMLHFPLKHLSVEAEINPHQEGWMNRYYKICLNMCGHDKRNIHHLVHNYLESLVWSFRYYFKELDSWNWVYPYHYAPTCLDIFNYLDDCTPPNNMEVYQPIDRDIGSSYKLKNKKHNKKYQNNKIDIDESKKQKFNLNHIKFTKGSPIKPQELLVMVLPYSSRRLMISNIQNKLIDTKTPLAMYFPRKYQLSIPYHVFYWECRPILPTIDAPQLSKYIRKIKMTQEEMNRNKLGENYTNF